MPPSRLQSGTRRVTLKEVPITHKISCFYTKPQGSRPLDPMGASPEVPPPAAPSPKCLAGGGFQAKVHFGPKLQGCVGSGAEAEEALTKVLQLKVKPESLQSAGDTSHKYWNASLELFLIKS